MAFVFLISIIAYNLILGYYLIIRSPKFLFHFILCNLVSNLVSTQMTSIFPGIAFALRLYQFLALLTYVFINQLKASWPVTILLIYALLIGLYHHDLSTFSFLLTFCSYYLLFIAGQLFSKLNFEYSMLRLVQIIVLICSVYLIITLTFGIGFAMYSKDVTVGELSHDRINILAFCFIVLFIYIIEKKAALINIVYLGIILIILLFVSKRLPLILIVIGIFAYFFFRGITRRQLFSFTILVSLIALIFVALSKTSLNRFSERDEKSAISAKTIVRENRLMEYLALPYYLGRWPKKNVLFGNRFDSTRDYRGKLLGFEDRDIHTGPISNIYRFGLVGFSIIYGAFLYMMYKFIRLRFSLNFRHLRSDLIIMIGFSLLSMTIIYDIVDRIHGGFPSFLSFLIIGFALTRIESMRTKMNQYE